MDDSPYPDEDIATTARVNGKLGGTLRSWSRALEQQRGLDGPADALGDAADAFAARPALGGALRGEWLGHALHPLMTDFPLGAWMSTSLLDLFGGKDARRSAEMLLTFGVAAALPTALTGLAELSDADRRARRVAVVHASVNTSALGLYSASLVARKRRSYALATALGVAGGLVATAGGYLGGHLSLVRGVGVERSEALTPSPADPPPPLLR